MKTLLAAYKTYARQHALYRRTRDEIARMSNAEATDLGIYPGDAERLARQAVWG
jgi:uncharacterized protein YjiS (DUF1127 family)